MTAHETADVPRDVLDRLVAKEAITDVVYRYCRAIDRMDRELALSCWHEGATVDYGELYQGSADGLVDWLWPLHRDVFLAHSHQVTNLLIEVRGDLAASEAYATVALRSRSAAGDLVDIVGRGRYLDDWSRRRDVWAITHRRHVVDLRRSSVVPDGDGTDGRAQGRRDRRDASYHLFGQLSGLDPDTPTCQA